MNETYINKLFNSEIEFSNKLSLKYGYPDNITHLLYVIIPAFIIKYGTSNKSLIENCFNNIPIIINDKQDRIYPAYYFSRPVHDNLEIVTKKGIVLSNYRDIGLMQLVDNLVHEFNHAINSMQNEIKIGDFISIRTGIAYNYYDKNRLTFVKKSDEIILEEVINTKQTELIIDIINSFSNYNITNYTVQTTLYSIYHSIDRNYRSNSYLLGSYVCTKLLENKTFFSTLEILRFDGDVTHINDWFNDIVGDNNSLTKLLDYLNQIMILYKKLSNRKIFRNYKINKIRKINTKAMQIVDKFNQNTIYK